MPIDVLLNGYVVTLLGVLCLLVLWSSHRQKRFRPTPAQDRIFRCQKCGTVYTDDPDVDRSRCSSCGTVNEPFEF
jgi:hypothetical protein